MTNEQFLKINEPSLKMGVILVFFISLLLIPMQCCIINELKKQSRASENSKSHTPLAPCLAFSFSLTATILFSKHLRMYRNLAV